MPPGAEYCSVVASQKEQNVSLTDLGLCPLNRCIHRQRNENILLLHFSLLRAMKLGIDPNKIFLSLIDTDLNN